MKKIIAFVTACIIASILFPSCKSNTSITKRLYTKGYYVAHNSWKHTNNLSDSKQPVTLKETKPSLYSLPKTSGGKDPIRIVNQNNKVENVAYAVNEKQENKAKVALPLKHLSRRIPLIMPEKKSGQIIPFSFKLKKIGKDSSAEDDARSLLWIIILVILVLWAVGFAIDAFALGGLIHILLAIALILFILWLLRIL